MTPRFELALAALLDLQDEVRDQWTQSYFQSRFYSAVEHGQNEALIKAAISLLQSLYNQCVRFLLKTDSGWLADHSIVADDSDPFTDNPAIALQFVTPEGAAERARALLHLFPDLEVEAVDVPMPSRTRGRNSISSVHG